MGIMSVGPDDERLVELDDELEILPDQTYDDTDTGLGRVARRRRLPPAGGAPAALVTPGHGGAGR